MKKFIYSVMFAVMPAAPALAAGDVLHSLRMAVSPSALENAETPVPAPAPVAASTPLTAETIKGAYLIRPYGFAGLQMILAEDVTIIRTDPAGDVVCKGAYKMDAAASELSASFSNCGGNSFSLKIGLAGQSVETLSAGVGVMGSGSLDQDVIPMLPIKLQKVK